MLLFSFEGTLSEMNPVVIARRSHPFPSRTRKLSSLASTILGGQLPGKIERCRNKYKRADKVNRLCPLCLYICGKWVHTKHGPTTKYRYSSIEKAYPQNSTKYQYSSIAQSVERMTVNHDVAGSSPAGGANEKDTQRVSFFVVM